MIPPHAIPRLSAAKRDDIRPAVTLTRKPAPAWLMPADRDDSRTYDRRSSLATMTGPLLMPESGPAKVAVFRRILADLATQGAQA